MDTIELEYGEQELELAPIDRREYDTISTRFVVWQKDTGTVAYITDDLSNSEDMAKLFCAAPKMHSILKDALEALDKVALDDLAVILDFEARPLIEKLGDETRS